MNCYKCTYDISNNQNIQLNIIPSKQLELDLKIFSGSNSNNHIYNIGNGLKVDEETNTLFVDTASVVEKDNTKPVTSAAVYTEIGNINALLETI